MKDTLKSIGLFILGICFWVGVVFLLRMLLNGCVLLSSQTPSGDNHVVLAIILFALGIVLFVLLGRTNSLWIFNRWMLWGAGLGFIIGLSVVNLVDTANHKGSGIVRYGGGGDPEGLHPDVPEFYAEVSEDQYKRKEFLENGIMLGIAVLAWVAVAAKARDEAGSKDGSRKPLK